MESSELIRRRYSVRTYKPDPVPDEVLAKVLEAACLAPTACNKQAFQLVVIKTKGREEELMRLYPRSWLSQAPLVIVACGLPDKNWKRRDGKNYNDVDVAIAMDHLVLAATDQGLGTCWVAAFDPGEAKKILALPKGVEPVVLTPLGYAADEPKPKQRRPLPELIRHERWELEQI